jgi:predicted O-methyltransferase YrrM
MTPASRTSYRLRKLRLATSSLFDDDPVLARLNRYLAWALLPSKLFFQFEGHISRPAAQVLRDVIAEHRITRWAEIGMNAGHSAAVVLSACPTLSVVSFDIGSHRYVPTAAGYLARQFVGRHHLVVGDSLVTLPAYAASFTAGFDGLLIDGGHTETIAWTDTVNGRRLCRPHGIVVMDDVAPDVPHGIGPTAAWERAVSEGLVIELARHQWRDSQGLIRRGMAVGHYT